MSRVRGCNGYPALRELQGKRGVGEEDPTVPSWICAFFNCKISRYDFVTKNHSK